MAAEPHTYELNDKATGPRVMVALISLAAVALGLHAGNLRLVLGMAAFGIFAAGLVAHSGLLEPHRTTLYDDGAVFEARRRRVVIPWRELQAVEFGPWNVYGGRIVWEQVDGRVLKTSASFTDVHRMLTEVERRAPHVLVST
jgi:hypothetical protein